MSKNQPVHTEPAEPVVDNPLGNAFVPGPAYKSTTTWSDGSKRVGYGDSKEEAESNSCDRSNSYRK
jgi:hypothetical protein